ncbi:hypothetical protein GGS24DRAFT_454781 [Hypoxylon argillaceum]|nr:hypothetical protein GGS24DRAFT_454781 [Hypoxylon argillaceum]
MLYIPTTYSRLIYCLSALLPPGLPLHHAAITCSIYYLTTLPHVSQILRIIAVNPCSPVSTHYRVHHPHTNRYLYLSDEGMFPRGFYGTTGRLAIDPQVG